MLETYMKHLNLWRRRIIEVYAEFIVLFYFSTAAHVQFAAIRCLVNLKIVLSKWNKSITFFYESLKNREEH